MIIGAPREVKDNEYRVAITPGGVRQLVEAGTATTANGPGSLRTERGPASVEVTHARPRQ